MSHTSLRARFNSTTNTLPESFISVCLNVNHNVAKAADPKASMQQSQQQGL